MHNVVEKVLNKCQLIIYSLSYSQVIMSTSQA